MSHKPPKCDACGDPAGIREVGPVDIPLRWKGRVLCQECYDELALGKVKNQNVNLFGGRQTRPHDLDESPYQANAIRNMEDG